MHQLTINSSTSFVDWMQQAPRPHAGVLRGGIFVMDATWEIDLRDHGRLLHDLWREHGGSRLVWTREGVVAELIRRSSTAGWEWVRSATTAWRVLHSSKGQPVPALVTHALAEVMRDKGAARFALDATRVESILAASTARGIRVDLEALAATRGEMEHTHKQVQNLMGFDPLPDENEGQTLAWLSKHGVDVPDIHSDGWGARTVSNSLFAREAERVYEHVLYLRRRYPKVRELAAKVKHGKLHTSLEPFAQVSGRISSTQPALNNIAADLRHLLVARPGHVFVTADFDGIEPRVLAALSGDDILTSHLLTGDPYADAAERAGFDRVEHRHAFKRVMISTMYGAGVGRTARQLGVARDTAERIRAALWSPYPVAAAWLKTESGQHGHRLDSGRPMGKVERAYARPNLIIQSTAYDIFQAAVLRVHSSLPHGAHIALPMHDELVIESPVRLVGEVKKVLTSLMPAEFRGVRINATPVEIGSAWRKV
jgi:hypothetical protein